MEHFLYNTPQKNKIYFHNTAPWKNKPLRKSVHHNLHISLRKKLIKARKDLGLSQRDLAARLCTTHSLIGKVETGDRRLDVVEFYEYTKALELVPSETLFLLFHEHQMRGGGDNSVLHDYSTTPHTKKSGFEEV